MAQELRMLPQDIEAEKSVLGAILMDGNAVYEVSGELHHYNFYSGLNDVIYRTMMGMVDDNMPIDVITLTDRMERAGLLKDTDDIFYVTGLLNVIPSSANITYYRDIVLECYKARRTIFACQEAEEKLRNKEITAEEAQESLIILADNTDVAGFQNIDSGIAKALELLENIHINKVLPGIRTGYSELDRMTGGLHKQEMLILAGRPSMGKTAFALGLMENLARKDVVCALNSLESGDKELGTRYLLQSKPDDGTNYQEGIVTEKAMDAFRKRAEDFKDLPIFIDDSGGQTLRQICSRARRLKARHKLDVLFIDYIQLMSGVKAENRNIEVGAYSSGLKQLSKELDISVVALSQLSRKVDDRPKKRPVMSDLRESGNIEQDADTIIFLYRPEVYGFGMDADSGRDNTNLAELIIGKQRNGPIGSIEMTFIKEKMQFVSRGFEREEQQLDANLHNDDNPF